MILAQNAVDWTLCHLSSWNIPFFDILDFDVAILYVDVSFIVCYFNFGKFFLILLKKYEFLWVKMALDANQN